MGEASTVISFVWKLDNFCFCDFYENRRLESPVFTINTPIATRWLLYMFPNGYGINKEVGIYLKRCKKDNGPKKVVVRFKISLLDSGGSLCPEAPSQEKVFEKDCEWGHNEFIKRNEIITGSSYLLEDSLTVVCQILNLEQNHHQLPRRQSNLQLGEVDEILNIYKALNLLYRDKLHSDMILQGMNKTTFDTHRCILRTRLPVLYNKLLNSPEKVFSDNFMTEKTLSYAYTGKIDMKDLCQFSHDRLKSILVEYGLLHLEKILFSQCDKYVAITYFPIKKCSYSWKIPTMQFTEEDEIFSTLVNDGFRKISFLICLFRNEGLWNIKIKPSSYDDVFLRCFITVKDVANGRIASDSFENLCRSNSWWLCPVIIRTVNDDLIFKDQPFSLKGEFLYMDFILMYPSGAYHSDLELATSSHTSSTKYTVDDYQSLLLDLEKLYRNPHEADFTIFVGKKEFNVHKCILCARSPYFKAMLEHDTLEKQHNQVCIVIILVCQ